MSLFERLELSNHPVVMLNIQYRMSPGIYIYIYNCLIRSLSYSYKTHTYIYVYLSIYIFSFLFFLLFRITIIELSTIIITQKLERFHRNIFTKISYWTPRRYLTFTISKITATIYQIMKTKGDF